MLPKKIHLPKKDGHLPSRKSWVHCPSCHWLKIFGALCAYFLTYVLNFLQITHILDWNYDMTFWLNLGLNWHFYPLSYTFFAYLRHRQVLGVPEQLLCFKMICVLKNINIAFFTNQALEFFLKMFDWSQLCWKSNLYVQTLYVNKLGCASVKLLV